MRVSFNKGTIIRSIDFSLRRKRVLNLIKRSNDKGDALVGTTVKLLKPSNLIAEKSVQCVSRGVLSVPRGRGEGVENTKVNVVFRSTNTSLYPVHAVKRRVCRDVHMRAGVAEDRTGDETVSLFSGLGFGSDRHI